MELLKKYIDELDRLELEYSELLKAFHKEAPQLFREARKAKGWSQRALADLLGVDYTYISKIENGHLKPGFPTVRKLGELLRTGKVDES